MIALYAVALELVDLPAVTGVDGAAIARIRSRGLDLVFSSHDAPAAASDRAVLEHARVVDAVAASAGALLPARFGHGYEDEAALERAAAAAAPALRAQLERVRGCVELGLRAVGPGAGEPPAARSGREYMERQRARVGECDRLVRDIDGPLLSLAKQGTRSMASQPRFSLAASYLVEPARIPAFRRRVAELERAHPALAFACTGPWPPYSFAEIEA